MWITALYSVKPSIKQDEGINTLSIAPLFPHTHTHVHEAEPRTDWIGGHTFLHFSVKHPEHPGACALSPPPPVRSAKTRLQSQTWGLNTRGSIVLQGGSAPRNHLLLNFNKSGSLLTLEKKRGGGEEANTLGTIDISGGRGCEVRKQVLGSWESTSQRSHSSHLGLCPPQSTTAARSSYACFGGLGGKGAPENKESAPGSR